MGKEIVTQIQEAQSIPYRINPRRNTPRHILIKLTKIKFKEKILKAAREKQKITYQGIPIRLSADFSAETLQARREWQDILKVMKEKNKGSEEIFEEIVVKNFPNMGREIVKSGKLRESHTG